MDLSGWDYIALRGILVGMPGDNDDRACGAACPSAWLSFGSLGIVRYMQIRTFSFLAAILGLLIGQGENVYAQDMMLTNLPSIIYKYKVEPYMRAAAQLQRMGRQAAIRQLIGLAKTAAISDSTFNEERTAILCRMLFTARPGSTFDRPSLLGGPDFLGGAPLREAPSSVEKNFIDWPSEPIEIVDGVPFLVVTGYTYEGNWDPRSAESYVRYCVQNCDWSSFPFSLKSEPEMRQALRKLIDSPKWRRPLEAWEQQYLTEQILLERPASVDGVVQRWDEKQGTLFLTVAGSVQARKFTSSRRLRAGMRIRVFYFPSGLEVPSRPEEAVAVEPLPKPKR